MKTRKGIFLLGIVTMLLWVSYIPHLIPLPFSLQPSIQKIAKNLAEAPRKIGGNPTLLEPEDQFFGFQSANPFTGIRNRYYPGTRVKKLLAALYRVLDRQAGAEQHGRPIFRMGRLCLPAANDISGIVMDEGPR